MKLLRYLPPTMILLAGVAGFFLLSNLRAKPLQDSMEVLPPLVKTEAVRPFDQALTLITNGEVVPYREVTISTEVSGRIAAKGDDCKAGRSVRRGDLLVQIDARDYELEVARLGELIRQAEISLEEVEIDADHVSALFALAEQELALRANEVARLQSLQSASIATQSALESVQMSQLQARTALQRQRNAQQLLGTRRTRAERDKSRLEAELERAKLALARTTIQAPVTGVVMEDSVEPDEYVQQGAKIARILDDTRLEVTFPLRLDELSWIWSMTGGATPTVAGSSTPIALDLPHVPVEIVLPLGGMEYIWEGQLSRYDGARVDAATRTVPCIAEVPNPRQVRVAGEARLATSGPPMLLQGMFVTLRIRIPHHEPLLEVPYTALRNHAGGYQLCCVEEGRIHFRTVELAFRRDDRALLYAAQGPQPGALVVQVAPPNAVDRMKVRTVESLSEPVQSARERSAP